MGSVSELKQEKARLVGRMRELLDVADKANRDLSRREAGEFDSLERDAEKLARQIEKLGGTLPPRPTSSTRHGRTAELEVDDIEPRNPVTGQPYDFRPGGTHVPTDGDDLVVRSGESMAGWLARRGRGGGGGQRLSLGMMVRGMITGDWRDAEAEQRALQEGVGADGGFLVPAPLAGQVIDRIRNASQCFTAGATLVPMDSATLSVPRLTAGSQVGFKQELAPIVLSDMEFDRVEFKAQTLPILVKISVELVEDLQPEASAAIENEMAQALSLELDRVILRGSGVDPVPSGILTQPGVTIEELGSGAGASPTWDDLIDGAHLLRNANVEPTAILWAPRTAQTMGKKKDQQDRYLEPPAALDGIARLSTNQIPTNLTVGASTDCSEVYIARWSDVLVGIRTDLRLQVRQLTERFIDELAYGLICHLRADVQLAHVESAAVLSGVRP
jgi:HK97 family phage major capsid protein